MSSSASVTEVPVRPARLLTQNREMRAIGVWNWTLPALAARLPDGRTQVTCPAASACTRICYARSTRHCIERKTCATFLLRRDGFD